MKKYFVMLAAAAAATFGAGAADIYLRGNWHNNWAVDEGNKFATTDGNIYTISNVEIEAGKLWKVADEDWTTVDYGGPISQNPYETTAGSVIDLTKGGTNCTLTADYSGPVNFNLSNGQIIFGEAPETWPSEDPGPVIGNYSDVYIRGFMNSWQPVDEWRFRTDDGNILYLDNVTIPAAKEWKIGDGTASWDTVNLGGVTDAQPGTLYMMTTKGTNCTVAADYTGPVTLVLGSSALFLGAKEDLPEIPVPGISNTLPVLFINIYKTDAEGNMTDELDNDVISMDLADKDYRPGEYWLDVTPCAYADELGYKNVGSKDSPLPLEMKARGNYTRIAYAKKPFKLKLGKKQSLLGMTPDKSKHWAILAHADDNCGYLRNFVGFNLGDRIRLPWTPDVQPVEVVINGDYRGLYFLTESIRVGDGRVPVQELDDCATDPMLASGGYLVELDNYDETNQIQMSEASCAGVDCDMLRVTWDTPEDYSDIQRRFITEQFSTMNNLVGLANTSEGDNLWKYLDLDDAARYYIVEEIISHTESYHGSTYLYRDRGEGQKWHFSPLWDCGNAFNGDTDKYFFDCTIFGNTWIPSLMLNPTFQAKVKETWKWFMANDFNGLMDDIDTYTDRITAAAIADHNRWGDAPYPTFPVNDNSDMAEKRQKVVEHLNAKINWLKGQWGDYSGPHAEPERDTTAAAALPYYVNPASQEDVMDIYLVDKSTNPWKTVLCYVEDGSNKPLGEANGSQMYKETVGTEKYLAIHFYPEQPLTDNAKVYFYNVESNTKVGPFDFMDEGLYIRTDSGMDIIGKVEIAEADRSATAYYDLQGRRLAAPLAKGVTIIRRGADVVKEVR